MVKAENKVEEIVMEGGNEREVKLTRELYGRYGDGTKAVVRLTGDNFFVLYSFVSGRARVLNDMLSDKQKVVKGKRGVCLKGC